MKKVHGVLRTKREAIPIQSLILDFLRKYFLPRWLNISVMWGAIREVWILFETQIFTQSGQFYYKYDQLIAHKAIFRVRYPSHFY